MSERKIKMDDYIDVAERVRVFNERYPEGSLQSELEWIRRGDEIVGVLCKAYAYRTPDDERPGLGHAYEPIPGKTPFTRDSEVMNAETSAWGRAIVALGFETKRIASAQEVRGRNGQDESQPGAGLSERGKADVALGPGEPAFSAEPRSESQPLSDAQRRKMWATARGKGLSDERVRELVQQVCGPIESTSLIPRELFNAVLVALEAEPVQA